MPLILGATIIESGGVFSRTDAAARTERDVLVEALKPHISVDNVLVPAGPDGGRYRCTNAEALELIKKGLVVAVDQDHDLRAAASELNTLAVDAEIAAEQAVDEVDEKPAAKGKKGSKKK